MSLGCEGFLSVVHQRNNKLELVAGHLCSWKDFMKKNEDRVWTGRKYYDPINLTLDLFPGHRNFTIES